jgi:hypothetical protein
MWRRTVALFVLAACSKPPRTVRQVDLDAWSGVPLMELATHPVFSTWQHSSRKLSDGREVWTQTKCESGETPVICMASPALENAQFTPAPFTPPPPDFSGQHLLHHTPPPQGPHHWPFPSCRGGASYEICCHAQFVIRGAYVESSRAVGNCFTDCRHRPASRQCAGEAPFATAPSPLPPSDAMLAEIRKRPAAPALGATIAEVKGTCEQQRGQFSYRDDIVECRVGTDVVFLCKHDAQQMIQCDTFFEGGDLAAFEAVAEQRFGPANVGLSPVGSRLFSWPSAGYAVTTYPKGVQVTLVRVSQ